MRGVRYYDALFHIEDQIKDLSPEERKQKRNDLATLNKKIMQVTDKSLVPIYRFLLEMTQNLVFVPLIIVLNKEDGE